MENEKQLAKGISMLYDMELSNYYLTRAIGRLDYEMSILGFPAQIRKPSRSDYVDGVGLGIIIETAFENAPIACMISPIIGIIVGVIARSFSIGLAITICGPILAFIVSIIIGIVSDTNDRKKGWKDYEEGMREFNNAVEKDNMRVKSENNRKNNLWKQKQLLVKRLQESQKVLWKFYDEMGIDKNYRNLVPIGYMDEFIKLGVATKLGGADGLYYLIRKELRMDQMQASLNDIVARLNQIISNQSAMYSQLVELNRKCDEMIYYTISNAEKTEEMLDSINSSASISAYNSERILKEQEYQSFFMTLQSI